MKLKDARDNYYTFSASLSGVSRQLCFAGIAIIWVFSVDGDNGQHFLRKDLMFPLGFFVLGLALDLMHYIAASAIWGMFHRIKEKSGVGEKKDFGAPRWINWFPCICFWGKALSTIIGYVILLSMIGTLVITA
ncbi:MAG: hypothetical protein R3D66_04055 [Alphaproteobacteria bacterium]